ncbi:hypothetical protein CJU94_19550 [Paraburkholderia aromaticivorans]|uniref:Uncharacterized protein n=1 Tax=Paraburkholderia aromaticivorans TaxID=2026199 RepID=A0A248VMC5_9BURK|nr:hypothetical protein CJU94_19550 [Paraburkholderia aromaticivorans]
MSTSFSESTVAGNTKIIVPDLFVIRECNGVQCAEGAVKTTVVVAVEHVDQHKAKVQVTVRGDIGASQTLKSQTPVSTMETTRSVDNGVPVITDQFSQAREATIPLGQARQIRLPHDLRAQICIARSVNGMPDGSCNFLPLQMNEGIESSTPLL